MIAGIMVSSNRYGDLQILLWLFRNILMMSVTLLILFAMCPTVIFVSQSIIEL